MKCLILLSLFLGGCVCRQIDTFDSIVDTVGQCFGQDEKVDCLKRKIIEKIDDSLIDNEAIHIGDIISIKRDSTVKLEKSEAGRSLDEAKGTSLDGLLLQRISDYFSNLVVQFKFNDAKLEEGRRRKGHKFGNMMMYGALGVAAILVQLFMGKLALVSGTALLLAKISLMIAFIAGIKKLAGGSGSEHIVYTDHGGWQRSGAVVANDLAYRGYKGKKVEDVVPSQIEYSYFPDMKNEIEVH